MMVRLRTWMSTPNWAGACWVCGVAESRSGSVIASSRSASFLPTASTDSAFFKPVGTCSMERPCAVRWSAVICVAKCTSVDVRSRRSASMRPSLPSFPRRPITSSTPSASPSCASLRISTASRATRSMSPFFAASSSRSPWSATWFPPNCVRKGVDGESGARPERSRNRAFGVGKAVWPRPLPISRSELSYEYGVLLTLSCGVERRDESMFLVTRQCFTEE
mmetsp:Transcript_25513/g.60516  ORF Transcript_25513/g.60516 Transcript_25513/m.60516 type:complete len:221 (+) Transcript_25513:240-902(+)